MLLTPTGTAAIAMTCAQYLLVIFFDDSCGEPPEDVRKCLTAVILCKCIIYMYGDKPKVQCLIAKLAKLAM